MSTLVGHVLEKVKGLVVDPQRLAVIKEEVWFLNKPKTLW